MSSINSKQVGRAAAARGRALMSAAARVVTGPTFRRVAPILLIAGLHLFVATTGAYAQGRGNGTFGGAARRLFDEFYDNWRGEFCLIAVAASGIALWFMGRNAAGWILKLLGGVLLVTMAPEIKDFVEYLAGH